MYEQQPAEIDPGNGEDCQRRKEAETKRTAKLTIETERVLVIRRRGLPARARCPACGEVVDFVTGDEAATLAHVGARAIARMAEVEKLHSRVTAEDLLICFNSLSRSLLRTDAR